MGTKRKTSINPGWYQIGQAQTINPLSTVTFDMSSLLKIISDAKMLGKTPFIHTLSLQINYAGKHVVSAAAASVADIQRGCFFGVNIEQPNIKNSWFNTAVVASHWRIVGRLVNAGAVALDRLLPYKRRLYQRQDTTTSGFETWTPSTDVDKRPDLCAGFGDDENFQAVTSMVATDFEFSDIFSLPTCKATIGGFSQDKLPAEMLCDARNPWKVSVTEQLVGGNSLRTDMFKMAAPGDIKIVAGLWVYMSFTDANSPLSVGVQWTCGSYAFNNNGPLPSHYHAFIGFLPKFNGTLKDGGALNIPVPYEPENYATQIANGQLRISDCNQQIFPLNTASGVERIYEVFNVGGSLGEHPVLNYDERLSDTRFKGPGSTLAVGETNSLYGITALGYMTGFTVFPLVTNQWLVKGFMPNIMEKPGCQADLRVQLEGATVPATPAFDIYVAEYESDREIACSYAQYGIQNGAVNMSSWVPTLANDMSALADTAKDIVPCTLNR